MVPLYAGRESYQDGSQKESAYIFVRFCLFFLIIFTPLARGAVQGWAITVIHFLTIVALFIFFMDKIMNWEWRNWWIGTSLDWPILLLSLLIISSTVFSTHPITSLWSSILFFDYIAWFYLTLQVIRSRTHLKQLVYLIIIMGLFLSIFGIFKKLGLNPFPWWNYDDLKYSPDLVSSTFGNHNHFAAYLEMVIPLGLGLFISRLSGVNFLFLSFAIGTLASAWILTLSRGSWASLTAGFLLMIILLMKNAFIARKRIILSVFCIIFFIFLAILSSSPVVERIRSLEHKGNLSTFEDRTAAWQGTSRMIRDYPVLGTGPGTFGLIFTQYQPPGLSYRYFFAHNDYLQFIAETGFLVIPLIVWLLMKQYFKAMRRLKNYSGLIRGTALGSLTGMTAILVHSLVDFNLHIPANAVLFIVTGAIVHLRFTSSRAINNQAS